MKKILLLTLLWCFGATACATNHMASNIEKPQPGTIAPNFTLPNQEAIPTTLSDFHGKWVVLYFYPKDFTGGCTLEAHNFQADIAQYEHKNAIIIGVSLDSVESHKKFCVKEGLNFKLLSDADHSVSAKYGSLMNMMGHTLASRSTFLIDPTGVIRKIYPKANPATHSAEVLADLDRLEK